MSTVAARRIASLSFILAAAACASRQATPAALDNAHDQCASCRMIVSDHRFASQVAAPYEEPRFFDDMSCLADYLATATLPKNAVVYVADHRTKAWVPASEAVYTRLKGAGGAMGSQVAAHASVSSRDADPDAVSGEPLDRATVFPRVKLAGSLP
jgi:copper chaperone NosL